MGAIFTEAVPESFGRVRGYFLPSMKIAGASLGSSSVDLVESDKFLSIACLMECLARRLLWTLSCCSSASWFQLRVLSM